MSCSVQIFSASNSWNKTLFKRLPFNLVLMYSFIFHQYMILICKRASGELKTAATWIREFVQKHPAYKQDSVVSQEIAYDLVMEMRAIGEVG